MGVKSAIQMQEKALIIAHVLFGDENFNTFDCMITLAQLYEQNGQSGKADELFKDCMKLYDKKEFTRHMIRGQEINDDVHDLSFDSRDSRVLLSGDDSRGGRRQGER